MPERIQDTIGKRLNQLRTAQGLRLQDVADSVGTARTYISDIESGRACPSVRMLSKICEALNAPASYFLADTSPKIELQYPRCLVEFLSDPDAIDYVYFAAFCMEHHADLELLKSVVKNKELQPFFRKVLKEQMTEEQQRIVVSIIKQFV